MHRHNWSEELRTILVRDGGFEQVEEECSYRCKDESFMHNFTFRGTNQKITWKDIKTRLERRIDVCSPAIRRKVRGSVLLWLLYIHFYGKYGSRCLHTCSSPWPAAIDEPCKPCPGRSPTTRIRKLPDWSMSQGAPNPWTNGLSHSLTKFCISFMDEYTCSRVSACREFHLGGHDADYTNLQSTASCSPCHLLLLEMKSTLFV